MSIRIAGELVKQAHLESAKEIRRLRSWLRFILNNRAVSGWGTQTGQPIQYVCVVRQEAVQAALAGKKPPRVPKKGRS